jgi:hypothetical protein
LHQLAKKLLVMMMLYLKPQYPSSTGISFIELILLTLLVIWYTAATGWGMSIALYHF